MHSVKRCTYIFFLIIYVAIGQAITHRCKWALELQRKVTYGRPHSYTGRILHQTFSMLFQKIGNAWTVQHEQQTIKSFKYFHIFYQYLANGLWNDFIRRGRELYFTRQLLIQLKSVSMKNCKYRKFKNQFSNTARARSSQ